MRDRGTFPISTTIEPTSKAPFDARSLAGLFTDLVANSSWVDSNGNRWIYKGMTVTVKEDDKLGIYILTDVDNYMYKFAWKKVAGISPFENRMINPLYEGVDSEGDGVGWEGDGLTEYDVSEGSLWIVSDLTGTATLIQQRTTNLPKVGERFVYKQKFDTTAIGGGVGVELSITYLTSEGNVTTTESVTLTNEVRELELSGIVGEGKTDAAVVTSMEVEVIVSGGEDALIGIPELYEGVYADILLGVNNTPVIPSEPKETLTLNASVSDVVDCSKYNHIIISNLGENQRVALSNLEEGKSYTLIFHVSASEANTFHKTTPAKAHEGKNPTHRIVTSLNDMVPGIDYDVQLDVYAISSTAYVLNGFHIF